jgi:acyl dehydratase
LRRAVIVTAGTLDPTDSLFLHFSFIFSLSTGPELPMRTYDDLQIGDQYSSSRYVTTEDVRAFAEVTGDDNPIHTDEAYARRTKYGGPIVHGVLLMGLISKVLGRDFPGPGSIAVGISCRFLRPVPVGSEVTVEVKIVEKVEKTRHVRARVYAYVAGKMVLGGEATLVPPVDEVSG